MLETPTRWNAPRSGASPTANTFSCRISQGLEPNDAWPTTDSDACARGTTCRRRVTRATSKPNPRFRDTLSGAFSKEHHHTSRAATAVGVRPSDRCSLASPSGLLPHLACPEPAFHQQPERRPCCRREPKARRPGGRATRSVGGTRKTSDIVGWRPHPASPRFIPSRPVFCSSVFRATSPPIFRVPLLTRGAQRLACMRAGTPAFPGPSYTRAASNLVRRRKVG